MSFKYEGNELGYDLEIVGAAPRGCPQSQGDHTGLPLHENSSPHSFQEPSENKIVYSCDVIDVNE